MKKIPSIIYLPTRRELKECLEIVEKADEFSNGFIDYVIKSKEFGYSSGKAFTIMSLISSLVLDIGYCAENLEKDKKPNIRNKRL